ncbi:hypothetical protein Hypma_007388 [Hypsizygus marmoreus]|uniref:Uncharacterized protein n=1 Tax=Hypsizygus marmoreus TaxID=39966 RepID=A0A369JRI1_HYPMA|nr:hypothetical protein Hypma_007388 [Hypsizygus marmoreus]
MPAAHFPALILSYSYLASVPLIVVFSVAMTASSSRKLCLDHLVLGDNVNRRWVLPLYFVLSLVWSLEMYASFSLSPFSTQLQTMIGILVTFPDSPPREACKLNSQITAELTFWVFLLNQGPRKRDWFASWEFRVWKIGKAYHFMHCSYNGNAYDSSVSLVIILIRYMVNFVDCPPNHLPRPGSPPPVSVLCFPCWIFGRHVH